MFQTMPSTPVPALVMPIVSGCMKRGLHSLERNRFTLNRDFVPDSLFARIFCGKPVSTFPENALVGNLFKHGREGVHNNFAGFEPCFRQQSKRSGSMVLHHLPVRPL